MILHFNHFRRKITKTEQIEQKESYIDNQKEHFFGSKEQNSHSFYKKKKELTIHPILSTPHFHFA